MKKAIIAVILVMISMVLFSQERGLHLTVGGNAANTRFLYDLPEAEGHARSGWGYGIDLGAQYFFNEHLGLSLGVEWSVFNTRSFLAAKEFLFPGQIDKDGDLYDQTIRFTDWTEKQTTQFLDIPLMLRFQDKWGRRQRHGFYLAAGIKAQFPIKSTFTKEEGSLNVSAFYPELGLTLGEEGESGNMSDYGYGRSDDRNWTGDNHLKMGLSVAGEAGFLIGLSRRVDLTVGIAAEYGLLNLKENADPLLSLTEGKTPQDGTIAQFVNNAGVLNSNLTSAKIQPLALKAHIGLKIKIGKLKEKVIDEFKIASGSMLNDTAVMKELLAYLQKMDNAPGQTRDTIIVNAVYPVYPGMVLDSLGRPVGTGSGYPYPGGAYPNAGNGQPYPGQQPAGERIVTGVPTQQEENFLLEPIYFDLNKSELHTESMLILDRKVDLMNKYPKATLFIMGHTCDLASDSYNLKLSMQRAESARNYIIGKGIDPKRIEVVPMGKRDPSYPNLSEDLRKLNRRDDFFLFMKK